MYTQDAVFFITLNHNKWKSAQYRTTAVILKSVEQTKLQRHAAKITFKAFIESKRTGRMLGIPIMIFSTSLINPYSAEFLKIY